ncbi:MAG: response regulator [Nitrospinae bacterium]|nr:response regulator [Nitrospinota bacterium]
MEPQLIITDLNMPRMDGFELLKELNGSPEYADIPVLVGTSADPASQSGYDVRTRVLRLGAKDFVSIPYGRNELLPRVSKLLA